MYARIYLACVITSHLRCGQYANRCRFRSIAITALNAVNYSNYCFQMLVYIFTIFVAVFPSFFYPVRVCVHPIFCQNLEEKHYMFDNELYMCVHGVLECFIANKIYKYNYRLLLHNCTVISCTLNNVTETDMLKNSKPDLMQNCNTVNVLYRIWYVSINFRSPNTVFFFRYSKMFWLL